MYLTEYETTVVVRSDLGGDAIESLLDKVREVVRNQGGKLLAINHWGKRKLAYEIEKQTRGIYVHTHFLGPNTLVAELERNLRISDNVLRYLTVQLADKVKPGDRQERDYVKPQYDQQIEVQEETMVSRSRRDQEQEEDQDEMDFADEVKE